MAQDQAVKFILRMFSHAAHDRIAILAVPRSSGRVEQRVLTLPQATSRKVQSWLRHLNARDYDIYPCVNPVRHGSRGREKTDIDDIRRLRLDLDEDGGRPAAGPRGRGQGCAPAPGPRAAEFEGPLPDPLGHSSRAGDPRAGRGGDAGAGGPLRQGSGSDGCVACDEAAGLQEQEVGQGRGRHHLAWHGGTLVRLENPPQ